MDDEHHEPGVDYPRWITEELIEQAIKNFGPKKKDGPFTREEAIDILMRLGVLLEVTGLLKIDLPDFDDEPSPESLSTPPNPSHKPAKSFRAATKKTKTPKKQPMAKPQSFTCFADLANEVTPPADGTLSRTLHNDGNAKVVLFGFAAGEELSEHTASMPAILQIIKGEATLTIGEEAVAGKPGTWIHMAAKTPHSVKAQTPMVMLLTLLK